MEVLIQHYYDVFFMDSLYADPNLFKESMIIVKVSDIRQLREQIVQNVIALYGELDYLSFEIEDSGLVPQDADLTWYKVKVVYVTCSTFNQANHCFKQAMYAYDDDY